MLSAIAACAQFPADSANNLRSMAAQDHLTEVLAQEEALAVFDRRQELFTLFRNLCKLSISQACGLVEEQLQLALKQETPWQVWVESHCHQFLS